ncbi:YhdP family phospholipid transporter [Halomonas sp. LS-001]
MTVSGLRKWLLFFVACCLGFLAVTLLLLRLAMSQAEWLTPHLESLLESRIGAPVDIQRLSLSLAGNDPSLTLAGVTALTPAGEPLFRLNELQLRLDSWQTLSTLSPVFNDAYIEGFAVHLYQADGMAWQWPAPAKLPLAMEAEPGIDLALVDAWVGIVLRQQIQVKNSRIILHGENKQLALHAPMLTLSGDERRTHLQGRVNIDSPAQSGKPAALPAAHLRAEVQPGRQGLSDFSAAMQLDMQLDQLSALMGLLQPDATTQFTEVGGSVQLWGRWQSARLQEARLGVDMPTLTLEQSEQQAVLRNIKARGIWQRDGEGGKAWLSGDAENVEWARPEDVGEGPALPRHWQFSHQPGHWELLTSEFELASLAAWRDYMLLPESVTRALRTLNPRGQVNGLRLGQRDGEWRVDAAISRLTASPWQQAPGGGPFDAWVQARDVRGRVLFSSQNASTLELPELFSEPLALTHAEGEIQWVYDGPTALVSGKRLRVKWNDAEVRGGFGLVNTGAQGRFGLDLNFSDVDAVNRPLVEWLPVSMLDPALSDWLSNVSGYVNQGSLQMGIPLGVSDFDTTPTAIVDLQVSQGSMPLLPDWPALSGIEGAMSWRPDEGLSAKVERALIQGIVISQGDVTLHNERLNVNGALGGDIASLRQFLASTPLPVDERLDDFRADGRVDAELDLSLLLNDPEQLDLALNITPSIRQITYLPQNVTINDITGKLTWQQEPGKAGELLGNMAGRWLEGEVSANLEPNQQVMLDGQVSLPALLTMANADARLPWLSGSTRWQGQLDWSGQPRLQLESDLKGVGIDLPEPFDKGTQQSWPWMLSVDMANGRIESNLNGLAGLRSQRINGEMAGALHVGPSTGMPAWPVREGWQLRAELAKIDPLAWQAALQPLTQNVGASTPPDDSAMPDIQVSLDTACLEWQGACVGRVSANGQKTAEGLDVDLDSEMFSGRVRYRQQAQYPLDITVETLDLDALLALSSSSDNARSAPAPDAWFDEVQTQRPTPAAIPEWLSSVPDGRLRMAEVDVVNQRLGPLTAYWQTQGQRFTLAPVGLTLGQLSLRGELEWTRAPQGSVTTADVTIQGGDVGTALERLGQPVVVRSRSTDVEASLDWPGAPWQFSLSRADGRITTDVREGRFLSLDSATARLVGLLNIDNILRRLRLDFSDVTGEGTAFNRVHGAANVGSGQLRLDGPLMINTPATKIRLTGSADLLKRELDQRLAIALPISQSLPIAALAVGAPVVGGALLLAHSLFGDTLEQVTTINYLIQGPWAAPQVTREGSQ